MRTRCFTQLWPKMKEGMKRQIGTNDSLIKPHSSFQIWILSGLFKNQNIFREKVTERQSLKHHYMGDTYILPNMKEKVWKWFLCFSSLTKRGGDFFVRKVALFAALRGTHNHFGGGFKAALRERNNTRICQISHTENSPLKSNFFTQLPLSSWPT